MSEPATKRKILRRVTENAVPTLAEKNIVLQRIYTGRGITEASELDYKLSNLTPPETLHGIEQAARLLADTIEASRLILIIGDFDADGATSTALAVSALRNMGVSKVDYIVPNRFEYGYGLTPEIVEVAKEKSPALIVTVDNGISSIDGVATAKAAGISVLITDHHLAGSELPDAEVIVNPNQPDCKFLSKNLAGVGVIFYVMSVLRRELERRNWFARQKIEMPNMAAFLDLVALGTVADVVPLDYNNRLMVSQGLARIRAGNTGEGIRALLDIANKEMVTLSTADLGFAIGPRLNAAGRLDDMALGIECLLSKDREQALSMARQLDDLNRDRRAIEQGMQLQAFAVLSELDIGKADSLPTGLCLYNGAWHQGVIGILASRIKDKLHRPVIVFADGGPGEIKGSARSIVGFHIRDALDAIAARNPGLLSKFGGHAMAAGMTLASEDYQRFSQEFDREARDVLNEEQLESIVITDGELADDDFDLSLAHTLFNGGPWGQHFPEPQFDGEFELLQQRIVGEKHLKMVVRACDAAKTVLDAIAFNIDTDFWPNSSIERVKLCYRLDINRFRGQESLQLMVEYIEPV